MAGVPFMPLALDLALRRRFLGFGLVTLTDPTATAPLVGWEPPGFLAVRPNSVRRLLTRDELIGPSCPAAHHASSTVFRFAVGFVLMKSRTNAVLLGPFALAVAMVLPHDA